MSPYQPERFGVNLKEIVKELGLTHEAFAKMVGLTPAAISQLMSGQRLPTLRSVCKILNVVPASFERMMR